MGTSDASAARVQQIEALLKDIRTGLRRMPTTDDLIRILATVTGIGAGLIALFVAALWI